MIDLVLVCQLLTGGALVVLYRLGRADASRPARWAGHAPAQTGPAPVPVPRKDDDHDG